MLNCLKLPSPLHLFVILPVVAAGALYDSADSVLAITGGTGEFAGALREMALSARDTKGDAYNFVYWIK